MLIKLRHKYSYKGFTTIELLVVVALMMVVISAASSIFLLISRTQKRIIADQQVQSNVRFALETIARDIHVGSIDYNYYADNSYVLVDAGGIVQPMQILALLDSTNQPILYRLNTVNSTLEASRGLAGNWQPLLSGNVQVTNVRFYIVPESDPFVPCPSSDCSVVPNKQPRVTISITAQNVPEPGYPIVSLWLQTTVLTRSYRR